MKAFLLASFITALVLWAGGFLLFDPLPAFFYQTLALLTISTVGLYRFLINIKREKPDLFVQLYLATLAIKLLAYGAYIFVMVLQSPGQATGNVLFLMAGYALFTVVETVFLYRVVTRP